MRATSLTSPVHLWYSSRLPCDHLPRVGAFGVRHNKPKLTRDGVCAGSAGLYLAATGDQRKVTKDANIDLFVVDRLIFERPGFDVFYKAFLGVDDTAGVRIDQI